MKFLQGIEMVTKQNYELACISSKSKQEIEDFFALLQPHKSQYSLERLGKDEASYVIPEDLDGISHCISPGYGGLSSFEEDLFSKYNIESLIIDRDIEKDLSIPGVKFSPNFLDLFTCIENQNICLEDLIHLIGADQEDLLLQLDIEANEWLILRSLSVDTLSRFRIMAIELHSLPLTRERFVYEKVIAPTLKKLLSIFYIVSFEVHKASGFWTIDNKNWFPDTIIVTFHRKNRYEINNQN